jgi:hypothetical protein
VSSPTPRSSSPLRKIAAPSLAHCIPTDNSQLPPRLP